MVPDCGEDAAFVGERGTRAQQSAGRSAHRTNVLAVGFTVATLLEQLIDVASVQCRVRIVLDCVRDRCEQCRRNLDIAGLEKLEQALNNERAPCVWIARLCRTARKTNFEIARVDRATKTLEQLDKVQQPAWTRVLHKCVSVVNTSLSGPDSARVARRLR